MTPVYEFRVYGQPHGQPRARAFGRKLGGKFIVSTYNPATAEGWKSLIAQAAKEFLPKIPLSGPVRLHACFIFPRPKFHHRQSSGHLKPNAPIWHIIKPDRDNLEKALLDALTNLGFWKDDCQVCAGEVMKRYTKIDERPGVTVILSQIP